MNLLEDLKGLPYSITINPLNSSRLNQESIKSESKSNNIHIVIFEITINISKTFIISYNLITKKYYMEGLLNNNVIDHSLYNHTETLYSDIIKILKCNCSKPRSKL
jgi:hypothetical protein